MQIENIEKKPDGRIQLFLQIFTGRTHQIRVYLSNHGLSIIGDYLYGKESEEAMQLTAYQLEFEDLGGENRFLLFFLILLSTTAISCWLVE